MKKRTISLFLSLILIFSLCVTTAYAASYSPGQEAQIAQLEKEIADLQTKMNAYGTSVGVIGTVVDTTSYYIIKGLGVDTGSIVGGNKYSVIDNPQDGYEYFGQYMGRHKKLGTITITLSGQSITCNHYGTMGSKYYELLKAKTAKEKELDAIKASPALLSANDLRMYSGGSLNQIVMQVDNKYLTIYGMDYVFSDATPAIVNGSTLLPIRAIIEPSCGTVNWDASTGTVTIQLGEKTIELKSNSTSALVNGNTVAMATPAQIINSRLMVPVRFVAENLGMKVDWVSYDKVIIITNPNYESSLFAERLALSGDYYTYTDYTDISCSYSYPAAWGKPTILRTYCGNGIYADNIKLTMPYAYLKINCELSPSTDLVNKVRTPGKDYETVPLTDKNTCIEAIVKTTDAYSKNSNTGEVLILATNGYVYTFSWMLNNMDSGLDQTMSDVLNIIKSFSKSEGVG